MPVVAIINGKRKVYSNLGIPDRMEGTKLFFGRSWCDFKAKTTWVDGPGYISFEPRSDEMETLQPINLTQTYSGVEKLCLTGTAELSLVVTTHNVPTVEVEVTGLPAFVNQMSLTQAGSKLTLAAPEQPFPNSSVMLVTHRPWSKRTVLVNQFSHVSIGNVTSSGDVNISVTGSNVIVNGYSFGLGRPTPLVRPTLVIKVPAHICLDLSGQWLSIEIGQINDLTGRVTGMADIHVQKVADVTFMHDSDGDLTIEELTQALDLIVEGNGAVKLAEVTAQEFKAELNSDGAFSVEHGQVAVANLTFNGHGEVTFLARVTERCQLECHSSSETILGQISGALIVEQDGDGQITVEAVQGSLTLTMQGDGDFLVQGGMIESLTAEISDFGALDLQAPVRGDAQLVLATDGYLRLGSVYGKLVVSQTGDGDLRMMGGKTASLDLSVSGDADVNLQSSFDEAKIEVSGDGDVEIQHVGRLVSSKHCGDGDLIIG